MVSPAMRAFVGYQGHRMSRGLQGRQPRKKHGGVLGSLLDALLHGGSAKADERAQRRVRMPPIPIGPYGRPVPVRLVRAPDGRIVQVPIRPPPPIFLRANPRRPPRNRLGRLERIVFENAELR